jgi:hypothetical protein
LPLEGRTILLHAEQGLGDTIHFLRYASLVAARGGRVVVECQAPLLDLARGVDGVAEVTPAGQPLPAFDVHSPLLSLPRLFGTRADALPWPGPYLRVPLQPPLGAPLQPPSEARLRRAPSKARLRRAPSEARLRRAPSEARLRVGLAWAGNPEHPNDARRSCGFRALRPLLDHAGVEFHSLQKGQAPDGLRYSAAIETMTGVAQYIAGLDLVITVDSSLAHLAGAMGRRVWTLLADVCDWRWGMEAETTGWYPTMRLYRQRRRGEWADVLDRLKNSLVE